MSDALRLRRYDPRDADAVWTLHEWAMREAGVDPSDIPGTEDLRDVSGSYLDTGGEFLVGVVDGDASDERPPATVDERVVAMGGLLPNEARHADERSVPGAAELHRMRVAPTHQRRGYGRRLLVALEARGRARVRPRPRDDGETAVGGGRALPRRGLRGGRGVAGGRLRPRSLREVAGRGVAGYERSNCSAAVAMSLSPRPQRLTSRVSWRSASASLVASAMA